MMRNNCAGERRPMKEALASAAQQPLQVAARLTAAVANQAEEGGRRLGHKDAAPADPCEFYHECSVQMRKQEQYSCMSAAPGAQAEMQDQASDGALAAAGDSPGEGIAGASAASPSCQEVANSEQENGHDLAGLGKASKMFAFLKEDAASSAPDMSNMRSAQKIGAGPCSGIDPRASDYGIHLPLPTATLPDSDSHNTTASSLVSSPPSINVWPYAGKGNKSECMHARPDRIDCCLAVGWTRHFRQWHPHLQALQGGQGCYTPGGVHFSKGDQGMPHRSSLVFTQTHSHIAFVRQSFAVSRRIY